MHKLVESKRVRTIEISYHRPIGELLYQWHWEENLMHKEIGTRLKVPRPTITRWFKSFDIPSQPCTRFTNLNLLNTGPQKTSPAKVRIKKEFPWKFKKDFFDKWSPPMAYVLGFLCADGYVYKNSRGSCYVCFVSTDKELIDKIRNLLESNHKIGTRLRNKNHPNWKDMYTLQIGSKDLFLHLRKFGIVQNKSLIIDFPEVPKEFLSHFVRGYFDGDGCVHLGRYWQKGRKRWNWVFGVRFTSGSKAFLSGLWDNLKPYVRKGSIYKKDTGGYDLAFSHHDGKAMFEFMYRNASKDLFLERKYNIFIKAIKILGS